MVLSERIKLRRKEANLSQEGLAKKIDVSMSTLRRWENEERSPDANDLLKLAVALDTTVAFLVGETETKHINAVANEHSIIGGTNNSLVSGISGNAIVGLGKGRITTKTEHQQTLSDCGNDEVTAERPDTNVPSEKGIIFEYHEGYHEGSNASNKKSDKKIILVFPPGTSPEEMEMIISRSARAILGSDPREKAPEDSLKSGAGGDIAHKETD